MKITRAIYISVMTMLYCLMGFILIHHYMSLPSKAACFSVGMMTIEMLLIYYAIGLKKLSRIKEKSIIVFLCVHATISVFITINVFWFIESLFDTIVASQIDVYIQYSALSILNFLFINAQCNHALIDYELKNFNVENSEINQSIQLKKEAELFKLRQQVDPHFLFNSLNSIHALTHIDHKKANTMIYSLSQYFRNSIQKQDQNTISLEDEINDIRLYLSIEMVRFGHRLQVHEDIDVDVLSVMIPPLILQPLIENAIKYGIYGTAGSVNIHINIKKSKDTSGHNSYIQCIISNPYDPNTYIKSGTGFGIAGIVRRLYLTYSRNDLIIIEKRKENNAHIFRVILNIPYHH